MAMTMGGQGGPSHDMNVTPLIDVLLTLLVIFMIITPRTPMGESALVPQPPKNQTKQQTDTRAVVVQVLEAPGQNQPALKINQETTNWQDLKSQLFNIYKTRAEKVMFVKADTDIPWQDVAQVIDIAHNAGVDKVGLITAKIEQGG